MSDAGYRERRSRLPGAYVWARRTSEDAAASAVRVLPDACVDLLWVDGSLLVAGPDTVAAEIPTVPGRRYPAAIRLPPGFGGQLLGVPASEIVDRRPRLDQLWPAAAVRTWEARLAGSTTPPQTLEQLVVERSSELEIDGWPRRAAAMLRQGADVRAVARELGWSDRHLHRRSSAAFGYGPERLRRILRFQRAVAAARAGTALARVAADCGFADQAHLAKEARALAGTSMSELRR